jgi:hypothetical protein
MPASADEDAEIRELEVQVSEINSSLKFIKWIGGFLSVCAIGFLAYDFASVQRLARIEDAILALQKDSAELRSDLKERNQRIANSLDRIEKSLVQNRPSPGKPSR